MVGAQFCTQEKERGAARGALSNRIYGVDEPGALIIAGRKIKSSFTLL